MNVTTTLGKLALTCGEFVNNADYGIDLFNGGTATVSGAFLMDNGSGDAIQHTGTLLPLVRTCSLP